MGHIPVGTYLVELIRPGVLVELGVYTGVSYCAFCQAVDALGLSTRCFGVDNWKGDPQAGFFGPEVLRDLRDHHHPLYSDFSQLLQSSFDDALPEFAAGTIDLLHIDGFHSYQAVKKDWENWLPKMSAAGVVLLHDTSVQEEGFGVWKLWEELKENYPHFEFPHQHGLGVVGVGEVTPPGLEDLFSLSDAARRKVQDYFEGLGNHLVDRYQLAPLEGSIPEKEDRLRQVESELLEIKSSRAWKLTRSLWRLRLRLIPPESQREKIARALLGFFKGGKVQGRAGPPVSPGEKLPLRTRERRRTEPPSREGEWTREKQALAWSQDYLDLQQRIRDKKTLQRSQVSVDRPDMLSFEKQQLQEAADGLAFPAANSPRVSIIIPVWNQIKLTLECLTSIQERTKELAYEVIIIDDGSDDQTPELLQRIEHLKYLRNQECLGYVLSCNLASQAAQGEYLLFLNNDLQVTEGWLGNLVKTFELQDQVGAVGPRILFPDGRLQEAGAMIHSDGTTQLVGVFDDPTLPRYNYLREVDYCSGVCLLVRREDFEELGGYCEDFAPAYGEDVDLCLRLRESGKRILYQPQATIIHHLSASTDQLGADVKLRLATRNAQQLMERWGERVAGAGRTRLIAFYLPQYHPIPENDRWWGKGFTDWTNVVKAAPNYQGHPQPHLPADLGLYDLRVEQVLEEQAALARRYGVHGFCFYSYWFGGKRLLDLPLRRILESGRSPLPFCICWANENWTRTWDGHQDQILIAQEYQKGDAEKFVADMAPYLRHPDYIRIDGRPLLLVYRVDLLPDPLGTADVWRSYCQREGIGDPYLVYMGTFDQGVGKNMNPPAQVGFDAALEFPPHPFASELIVPPGPLTNPHFQGTVHDYQSAALEFLTANVPGFTRFRGVMPGWDNTPRRQDEGTIYHGSSPGAYQAWLEAALDFTREQCVGEERIVFLNAWNEWAEGAALEPDQRHGHGYLEATRAALERDLWKGGAS